MTEQSSVAPDYRVILLGASNVTLGLPRLVNSLRKSLPGKVELLIAAGHGRSYLGWSYVIHRGLPGIRNCQLWEALESRPAAQNTYALVTDLGCDLFYGAKPDSIIKSVESCINRLDQFGARTVFARPPLTALEKLTPRKYYLIKNLFFPGPTLPWETMWQYINEVDAGMENVVKTANIHSAAPPEGWYGIDPIHIRQSQRNVAWTELIRPWGIDPAPEVTSVGSFDSLSLWSQKAALRKLWWIPRQHQQPVKTWEDGSMLSLF